MNKGILKFCRSVLIVITFVAVIDVVVGYVMDWMLPQTGNRGDLCLTNLGVNADEYEGIGQCVVGYPAAVNKNENPRKNNYVYYVN